MSRVRALIVCVCASGVIAGVQTGCRNMPSDRQGDGKRGTAATARGSPASSALRSSLAAHETAFLDTLAERTFALLLGSLRSAYRALPRSLADALLRERRATGFALTAYPIGVEHGWVTREAAGERVLATLAFLWTAPQDTSRSGADRIQGLLLSLPGPGHRNALRRRRALHAGHGAAAGRRALLPVLLRRRQTRRRRRSAPSPSRSTRARTGAGPKCGRRRSATAGIPSRATSPTTGAATTRRC